MRKRNGTSGLESACNFLKFDSTGLSSPKFQSSIYAYPSFLKHDHAFSLDLIQHFVARMKGAASIRFGLGTDQVANALALKSIGTLQRIS